MDEHPELPDDQRANVFAGHFGCREALTDGRTLPLITILLTDHRPASAAMPEIDPQDARPDVTSELRTDEARKLAAALLDLADRLDAVRNIDPRLTGV